MKIDFSTLHDSCSTSCLFKGDKSLVFSGFNTVFEAVVNQIAWIRPNGKDNEKLINETEASCVFCDQSTFDLYHGNLNSKLFVITDDPKKEYFKVLKNTRNLFFNKTISGIHPTAIVDENCQLGENVSIGAYSIIGACKIDDGTIIAEFVKIHDSVTIGKNAIIREHVTIGGEGFGYYRENDNHLEHIPHIGNVQIGNDVHIFPFANIDRGTLSATIIEDGSVIDHYVHVSHNSKVGKNTIICATSVLAGGSVIKDNCFIGVNTLLKEKCIIGNGVFTGLGAVVIKDIPDNEVWVGNPAKFLKKN